MYFSVTEIILPENARLHFEEQADCSNDKNGDRGPTIGCARQKAIALLPSRRSWKSGIKVIDCLLEVWDHHHTLPRLKFSKY